MVSTEYLGCVMSCFVFNQETNLYFYFLLLSTLYLVIYYEKSNFENVSRLEISFLQKLITNHLSGELRHISKLKPWTLYEVLTEKYEWNRNTAKVNSHCVRELPMKMIISRNFPTSCFPCWHLIPRRESRPRPVWSTPSLPQGHFTSLTFTEEQQKGCFCFPSLLGGEATR